MNQKIDIVGDVNKIAQYIPWAKKQWVLREGLWYKDLKECLIEFKNISNSGYIRFFVKTSSGFVFHPRSSIYPNGINTDTHKKIDTPYPTFPLYDDDKGTMLLENVDGWQVDVPDGDNYGVHAWASEDEIVSWRGWPAITLGCSRSTSVNGVTEIEVSTAYNTFYTPLAGKLYFDGVAQQVPGKVRGSSISKFGTVIITTVNYTEYDGNGDPVNSANPFGINWLYDNAATTIPEELKPGKVGGYFDEMYVYATGDFYVDGRIVSSESGWVRIGFSVSNITNLPTWASSDGITFTGDDGTWSFSFVAVSTVNGEYPEVVMPNGSTARPVGTFTCSFISRAAEQNKYLVKPGETISSNLADPDHQDSVGSMWSKSSDLLWNICHMQTASANLFMKYSVGGQRHIGTDNENSLVPVKYQTRPDPVNYYIDVYRPPYTEQPIQFSAVGFKGSTFTWYGVDYTSGNPVSGYISYSTYVSSCGIKTVTVTDECGFTATVDVRMNNGYWCGTSISGYQVTSGCNHGDIPCNGCCGLASGYWYGDRPEETDLTATSYVENKYADRSWFEKEAGDILCTIQRTWVCNNDCAPLHWPDC